MKNQRDEETKDEINEQKNIKGRMDSCSNDCCNDIGVIDEITS